MALFNSSAVLVLVVLGALALGSAAESTASFNLTSSSLLGYNSCAPLKSGVIAMPSQAVAMGISLLPSTNDSSLVNSPNITAHYYSLFGNSSVGNEYSMAGQINFATVAAAATANVPELYVTPCFSTTAVPGGACVGQYPLSKLLNSPSIHNFAGLTLLDIKLFFYNSTVVGDLVVVDAGAEFWLCVTEQLSFNARVTFVFQ